MTVAEDFPERVYESFYANKWIADGSNNLEEVAKALESVAKDLREMHEDGVYIPDVVDNGMTPLLTNDPEVAKRYGFEEVEEDEDGLIYDDEDL